jgi:hypothetical protein
MIAWNLQARKDTAGYGQLVALQPAMAEHGASAGAPCRQLHCACAEGETTAQVEVQTTSTGPYSPSIA